MGDGCSAGESVGRGGGRVSTLAERFWAKVMKGDGCWEWTAHRNAGHGYGLISSGSRPAVPLLAHRVAWELTNGLIPDGMVIDHLCRNRGCVRPDHLEAVTTGLNNVRALQGPGADGSKCVNGHEFNEANTRIRTNGARACRACDRARVNASYARKKAKSE